MKLIDSLSDNKFLVPWLHQLLESFFEIPFVIAAQVFNFSCQATLVPTNYNALASGRLVMKTLILNNFFSPLNFLPTLNGAS